MPYMKYALAKEADINVATVHETLGCSRLLFSGGWIPVL
jgi:hypothetical protein